MRAAATPRTKPRAMAIAKAKNDFERCRQPAGDRRDNGLVAKDRLAQITAGRVGHVSAELNGEGLIEAQSSTHFGNRFRCRVLTQQDNGRVAGDDLHEAEDDDRDAEKKRQQQNDPFGRVRKHSVGGSLPDAGLFGIFAGPRGSKYNGEYTAQTGKRSL